MKSLIVTAIFTLVFAFFVHAQKASSELSLILSSYYNVKDALVNSDAKDASAKATGLMKTINSIDLKTLSATEQSAFGILRGKLISDANSIAENKNLEKQRAYFSSLSTNVYSLTKGIKLSGQPVYYAYCSMKKSFWLSNEALIKNPYYGNQMLSCGIISDILK